MVITIIKVIAETFSLLVDIYLVSADSGAANGRSANNVLQMAPESPLALEYVPALPH